PPGERVPEQDSSSALRIRERESRRCIRTDPEHVRVAQRSRGPPPGCPRTARLPPLEIERPAPLVLPGGERLPVEGTPAKPVAKLDPRDGPKSPGHRGPGDVAGHGPTGLLDRRQREGPCQRGAPPHGTRRTGPPVLS